MTFARGLVKKSSAEGRSAEFVRAAHTFKSTSATVGAGRLSDLAADLEKRGQGEQLTDLLPLISTLEEAYDEAKQQLQKIYS